MLYLRSSKGIGECLTRRGSDFCRSREMISILKSLQDCHLHREYVSAEEDLDRSKTVGAEY